MLKVKYTVCIPNFLPFFTWRGRIDVTSPIQLSRVRENSLRVTAPNQANTFIITFFATNLSSHYPFALHCREIIILKKNGACLRLSNPQLVCLQMKRNLGRLPLINLFCFGNRQTTNWNYRLFNYKGLTILKSTEIFFQLHRANL
jgi:hypothetical protein